MADAAEYAAVHVECEGAIYDETPNAQGEVLVRLKVPHLFLNEETLPANIAKLYRTTVLTEAMAAQRIRWMCVCVCVCVVCARAALKRQRHSPTRSAHAARTPDDAWLATTQTQPRRSHTPK